jgi:TRAP-type mannitol/chloroaromatic compound transport system substrate-binding protein
MKRSILYLVVISLFCSVFANTSFAADSHKFRMLSFTNKGLKYFWDQQNRLIDSIEMMSNKKLSVALYAEGELASVKEIFELVSSGTMEMGSDWPGYWSGKNTAFDLLAAQVMGLSPEDYIMWIYNGGGFELYQEIYGKFNLVYLPFDVTHMESGIRSNKPIRTLDDMKGMKIRLGGLVAGKVIQKFGAVPTMISGSELYEAARRGTVDGFEWSRPHFDVTYKMYEVGKYWSTPGWHQTTSVHGLLINKKVWQDLPEYLREIVKQACMAELIFSYGESVKQDAIASKFLAEKTIINKLSEADLAKIEAATLEIMEGLAKQNPDYAKVLKSQTAWLKGMEDYRLMLGEFSFGRNPVTYPNVK